MLGIPWRSGPAPVVIVAAQTGVTDGKAATQSDTYTPSRAIADSAGARPAAITRSSIAGFIASMTTSTSLRSRAALRPPDSALRPPDPPPDSALRAPDPPSDPRAGSRPPVTRSPPSRSSEEPSAAPLRTALPALTERRSPQDPQARVLAPRPPAPGDRKPPERHQQDRSHRGGQHRQHRGQDREQLAHQRQGHRRLPVQSRAHALEQRRGGSHAHRRAGGSRDQPRPGEMVAVRERARKQQRAEHHRDQRERNRHRARRERLPRDVALGEPQRRDPDHHQQRNSGPCRNDHEVWAKSIWTSPAASAPTASAGRNGRIPTAAAIPIPWRMSRTRCTVLYLDRS